MQANILHSLMIGRCRSRAAILDSPRHSARLRVVNRGPTVIRREVPLSTFLLALAALSLALTAYVAG